MNAKNSVKMTILCTVCSAFTSSKYVTPRLRTKFAERAFLHAGPAAWNSLPPDIHAAASPDMFKKLLKMHFLT